MMQLTGRNGRSPDGLEFVEIHDSRLAIEPRQRVGELSVDDDLIVQVASR